MTLSFESTFDQIASLPHRNPNNLKNFVYFCSWFQIIRCISLSKIRTTQFKNTVTEISYKKKITLYKFIKVLIYVKKICRKKIF